MTIQRELKTAAIFAVLVRFAGCCIPCSLGC